jgi:hypothetical protein
MLRMPGSAIISWLRARVNGGLISVVQRGSGNRSHRRLNRAPARVTVECDASNHEPREEGHRAPCHEGTGRRAFSATAAGLVRKAPARSAVAREPRSLPGVAFGDHAAADAGGGGDRALSRIPAALSNGGEAGGGARGERAGGLERPGLLPARAHAARGGQGVVREHGGKFPAKRGIACVAGIGRYTAAAIASIAFGEPVAVVDGNVERVLQRVSGKRLAGEELWATAKDLLDAKRPGDFNQAMMELGAVVCVPRAPACLTCPVVKLCATRGELAATSEGRATEEARDSVTRSKSIVEIETVAAAVAAKCCWCSARGMRR